MEEFVKNSYNNRRHKDRAYNSFGFMGIKSKDSKTIIKELRGSNNIEKGIDLLIAHLDEVQMIETNEVYKCESCEAIEEYSYTTIRCHKQVKRTGLCCKKCGNPMKLVKVTTDYM